MVKDFGPIPLAERTIDKKKTSEFTSYRIGKLKSVRQRVKRISLAGDEKKFSQP